VKKVAKRDEDVEVDLILCMGDDVQDKKMFTSVFSFIAESEVVDYAITLPNEEDSDMIHIQSSIECPIIRPVILQHFSSWSYKLTRKANGYSTTSNCARIVELRYFYQKGAIQ